MQSRWRSFSGYPFRIPSGQITMTSWRHGQKRTKVEKRVVFPIKTLTLEMSPIGMIQETQKKAEISDVVAAIVKKTLFF